MRVTFTKSMFLREERIENLFNMPTVRDAAARDVFGRDWADVSEYVFVGSDTKGSRYEGSPGSLITLVGELEVSIEDTPEGVKLPPAAEEFMNALCARVKETLEQGHKPAAEELHERLELAGERLARLRTEVDRLRGEVDKVRTAAGHRDLQREHLEDRLADLDAQKQSLEMELVARRARRQAIEEQIARIGKEVTARLGDDEVSAELGKVVELRERQAQGVRVMHEAERVSEREMDDALEKMALAKVELFRHRQEMSRQAGGGLLEEFNAELHHLAIDAAEMEARFKFASSQLEQIGALLTMEDKLAWNLYVLERLETKLDGARRRYDDLKDEWEANRPPSMTVISADHEVP